MLRNTLLIAIFGIFSFVGLTMKDAAPRQHTAPQADPCQGRPEDVHDYATCMRCFKMYWHQAEALEQQMAGMTPEALQQSNLEIEYGRIADISATWGDHCHTLDRNPGLPRRVPRQQPGH